MREPLKHPTIETMLRFCVVDRKQIDPKRVARNSKFCSRECHQIDRIERRRLIGERFCRLCKRPKPKKTKTAPKSSQGQ